MNQKDDSAVGFALRQRYPRINLLVSVALLASAGLLVSALTQPILYTQQMIFWKQTYTVWTGIVDLWKLKEYLLAVIVFMFSMILPFVKLFILACIWYAKLTVERRAKLLRWLGAFGKWSMLDVYVVAILVVFVKVGSLARVEPRMGVYFFGASVITSMLATGYIHWLANKTSFLGDSK